MASAGSGSRVLVTGASGFIATHVVKQLQEAGYLVRGTVRSLEKEEKIKPLKELCPDAAHELELVEADLTKPETWEAAVKDCTYVVHVASPFPNNNPENEKEVIEPAVEGTKSVVKACVESKTVKRIVLTSSIAAITGGLDSTDPEKTFTEEDWGDVEKADVYPKSKILAEKAAWDYIKELPEDQKIELAVINPGAVLGPLLTDSFGTSMEIIKKLFELRMPAVPHLNLPVCDVRDVAAAHVKALTSDEAAGNRHIIMSQNIWLREMSQSLAKEFKPQGYSLPTAHCPYFAVWIAGFFDKTIKMILPKIGKVTNLDNSRMKSKLEIEPKDFNETLIDSANSMIERGLIKKP